MKSTEIQDAIAAIQRRIDTECPSNPDEGLLQEITNLRRSLDAQRDWSDRPTLLRHLYHPDDAPEEGRNAWETQLFAANHAEYIAALRRDIKHDFVAPHVILSTPLGFPGQVLVFDEIPFPKDLYGMISYVGHPSTRALVEALGATTDTTGANGNPGKFAGLAVGESYLAVPLASNPRTEGWTANVAIESIAELKAILVTRID